MSLNEEPSAGAAGSAQDGGAAGSEPTAGAAGSAPPGGSLFNGLSMDKLSLSTAFEVAFKVLARPTLLVPVLGVSIAVNAFLEAFLLPVLLDSFSYTPSGRPQIDDLEKLLVGFSLTFVIGVIGSLIVALYGQIWTVAASIGAYPSIDGTFELAARRWASFLGASIVSALLSIGLLAVLFTPLFVLLRDNPALGVAWMLLLFIPYVYVFARISMITWLAADGLPVGASVRGSWRITHGGVLRILGWSLAVGLVVGLLSFGLGSILRPLPLAGGGIAQGIQLAMTYGFGVTLYRRTQAAAMPPAPRATTPPVPEAPIG